MSFEINVYWPEGQNPDEQVPDNIGREVSEQYSARVESGPYLPSALCSEPLGLAEIEVIIQLQEELNKSLSEERFPE